MFTKNKLWDLQTERSVNTARENYQTEDFDVRTTMQTQPSQGSRKHIFSIKKQQNSFFQLTNKSQSSYQSKRFIVDNDKINEEFQHFKETKRINKQLMKKNIQVLKDQLMVQEEPCGERAPIKYYEHFKNLEKVNEQNKFYQIDESCFTEFLNSQKKQQILHSKLGVIKERGDKDKLEINKMRYGDSYMRSLASGIKQTTYIKDFQLSHNRITTKSSDILLRSIPLYTSSLDLSFNRIGVIGIHSLSQNLINQKCRIISINLEDNKLRDGPVKKFLESLSNNTSLKYLNLSKNLLTDEIADNLYNFLEKGNLEELYLHWNALQGHFGQKIFTQLVENKQLFVMDLSNNLLSKGEDCIQGICQFLQKNSSVVHMDLSFNGFSFYQTQDISISLSKNETIYGFHFMGNSGYINTQGFLIPEIISQSIEKTFHKRIDGVKMVQKIPRDKYRDMQLRDCCWICQGWSQLDIIWNQGKSLPRKIDNLFIHFNYENYEQIYLGPTIHNTHKYSFMVPPGDINYFFSDHYLNFFTADDINRLYYINEIQNIKVYDQSFIKAQLQDIHIVSNIPNQCVINKKIDYSPTITVKPRTKQKIYEQHKDSKKQFVWDFSISLMANWRPDDAELINLCFNYDWECSKMSKIIKDPIELSQIKDFFRSRYKLIKDTYKFYSTWTPVGDIWAIQSQQFVEFLNKCKIIDKQVTQEFLVIKFTAVLSGQKTTTQAPASEILNQPELKNSIYDHGIECVDKMSPSPYSEQLKLRGFEIKKMMQTLQNNTNIIEEENDEDKKPEKKQVVSKWLKKDPIKKTNLGQVVNSQTQVSQLFFNKDSKIQASIIKKYIYQLSYFPVDQQGLMYNKNSRNPERGINRHQFMELLTRIAEEKYINQNQKTKNYYDAICMLWDDHLLQDFVNYDTQIWRKQRYHCEDVDACLKFYKKIIDHIYKKNAIKKVKPGQQPFMCLDEFNNIINTIGLYEMDGFGSQVYLAAFNNSMQTQIDELWIDRIFQMNIYEFYEALARIAEEASLPLYKGIVEDETCATLQQRQKYPLAHKLEALIFRLYIFQCDSQFKATVQLQDKSIFAPENAEIKSNVFKFKNSN